MKISDNAIPYAAIGIITGLLASGVIKGLSDGHVWAWAVCAIAIAGFMASESSDD